MRQRHVAGEKLFVDYSGVPMEVTDPATGTRRPVELFVAVLGASNYTYAEASWSQTLPDWIGAHVRAFKSFGGFPALIVSDNLKSAVVRAGFPEPGVNRSYTDLARHYHTAILPVRPYKPKDKAYTYSLARSALWVRVTASTIEAFQGGNRVASHQRAGPQDGRDTTVKAHMPAKHRHMAYPL